MAIAAVLLLAALAVVLFVFRDRFLAAPDVRQAGSDERIEPVGPVRMVAAMEPSEPQAGAVEVLPAVDPATVPDTKIRVDVEMKLNEMNLPAEPLDITVEDRRVLLEGRVEDALLRDAIEVTVRSVPGVRQVDNRLEVVGQIPKSE